MNNELSGYSIENLKRFRRLIELIINQLELEGWAQRIQDGKPVLRLLRHIKIPFRSLERDGFIFEESRDIVEVINKIDETDIMKIINDEIYRPLEAEEKKRTFSSVFDDVGKLTKGLKRESVLKNWLRTAGRLRGITDDDLKNNLVLEFMVINPLKSLIEIKEAIVKKMGSAPHLQNQNFKETITISVNDREIWVNDYLIGKPYAVGSNFEFFECIRSIPINIKIHREELQKYSNGIHVQREIKNKSFIKILNELGFKGELLRAFFGKRSKDTLMYRGDQISIGDLKNVGVKIPLFFKQLELAHIKNSPE